MYCDSDFLNLNIRQSRLLKEVETANPDILCVQVSEIFMSTWEITIDSPKYCLDVSLSQDTIVHNWKTYQSTWDHAFLSLFSQVHTKNSTWSKKLHICVSMIVEVYDWFVHAE